MGYNTFSWSGASGSNGWNVPNDVKYVDYIIVGGGGGGARPRNPPNFGRTPEAGGSTNLGTGLFAGGGGPGAINFGGSGGSGNWRNGSTGQYAYSEFSRASSGYGIYGSGGAGQWRSPDQSYGGGGGGASCARYCRGSSGAIPGQRVSWNIGQGGQQGGTGSNRYGDAGAVYAFVCTYDRPTASISVSPAAIILGQNSTLSWSAGGDTTSESINNNIGEVARSGSLTVSPQSTTTYTFTVVNPVYTVTATATLTVYRPPVVTLTTNAANDTIIMGESVTLSWSTVGDASSMTISPGIGQSNLNGSTTISPTMTTTYTATATGNGGTGSAQRTITVLSPPTLDVSGPLNVNYGQSSIVISIQATNVPSGITLTMTKTYNAMGDINGNTSVVMPTITIPNSTGDSVNIVYSLSLPWDTRGPRSWEFVFIARGYGSLTTSETLIIPSIIDETPDYIDVPETDDAFRNEEPIITPDVEVVSQVLTVSDIDIPVEVKSNYPIQIQINNDDIWRDMRQL